MAVLDRRPAVVLGPIYGTNPVLALFEAPRAFVSALPFIFQFLFFGALVIFQFVAIFWFLSKGGIDTYFPDIKTRFSDVWGQDHVVNRVKENIVFLENPESIEAAEATFRGHPALGPPGTGKTLMAEAVAGRPGSRTSSSIPAPSRTCSWVSASSRSSRCSELRKLALRYGGVIVFFDEADALGSAACSAPGSPVPRRRYRAVCDRRMPRLLLSRRTHPVAAHSAVGDALVEAEAPTRRNRFIMGAGMGGGAGMGTLQALLTEMSGLKKPRGFVSRIVRRTLGMRPKPPPKYRILIMMATNLPEALDEALPSRPHRPHLQGRLSQQGRPHPYYQGYFDKVRHELTPDDLDKLATVTPYATGASMKDLVNESLITAIRRARGDHLA